MPSKLQTYMQMADEAQRQITGSYRGWTGFLTTDVYKRQPLW